MPVKTLPPKISQREAFWFWLKLGFISFGGPAGQIAIMHQELVEHRRWISERRFLHALNYCMLLPGPEAQQLATYLGWLMHRTSGGLIAGGLFVLPSLLILIALSWVYVAFGHLTWIMSLFYGIKPAVAAIVLHAAFRIGSRALKNSWLWMIAACAFIAITILDAPFPLIVLSAAFIGGMGGRFAPRIFALGGGHAPSSRNKKQAQAFEPAVIDDDTPTPEHARLNIQHVVMTGFLGIVIWLASLFLIALLFGWRSPLTLMAWFFTKAALLTFGGAYAVLPYVYQGAVTDFSWLTAAQMMDGLALGETTPGPLIMVVTFVGFLSGVSQHIMGTDSVFLSGVIAALVVTWFTFLPSFVFIFMGGPVIEATHNDIQLTAPLTAITAAVVGVILNLALFFGYHVLWPQGLNGRFDGISASIAALAAIALFKLNSKVMHVIFACASAGLLLTLCH
jgi:chromate transporter